jgi:stearoyl-CoA 9-desaturase NADPH oxidoreductase
MTTTLHRPSTVGALRDLIVKFAGSVTTPLVPADYLDAIAPLRSGAALRGRIVAIRPETPDAATIVIKPGHAWRTHMPGQYIRLGIDVDGVRQWRAYSLTSQIDRADGCIAITVKAIAGGKVSNHLVRHATVGTIVQLDHAAGEFSLGAELPPKILFLTAGSGITPIMGMLRNMTTQLDDVVVMHSAPTPDDVIFGAELRTLAREGRIRLVERHTDTQGILDVADLEELIDDYSERETWACGPTSMLDALEQHWHDGGIADRLHTERFRPTVVTSGEGGTVTFTKSDTVLDAEGSQTLLDAGEAAGVLMPSGCRMGICFGCVAPLRQGAVRDLRNGEITTAATGDGVLIQTCVSAAAGSCDIDL